MFHVLDLFSAAAGGWSLGMHRAGFKTIAACENVAWRRALYQENNPDVRIYDDVCTLSADQLFRDFGFLPDVIVGSPPCQDISSANTKGKGVEGERSGLYFEAVRIIGEVRPRWFALENSANLRTRGADAVLAALEAIGYTCWAFVVGAGDIGANHERARSWIIGFDPAQVSYADSEGEFSSPFNEQVGKLHSVAATSVDATGQRHEGRRPWGHGQDGDGSSPVAASTDGHASGHGRATRWSRRRSFPASRLSVEACGNAADAGQERPQDGKVERGLREAAVTEIGYRLGQGHARNPSNADKAGQEAGLLESSLRQAEIAVDGCCVGRGDDGQSVGQMGRSESLGVDTAEPWTDWNGGITHHLRLDAGLSAWVADTRIAVGGPKGTSAASLIVEAFGDSVVPQIPEAIGRAIIRTERALSAVLSRAA